MHIITIALHFRINVGKIQVIMDSTKHFKDPDRLKIAKNKHKKHK
jgi:hypothetical protein